MRRSFLAFIADYIIRIFTRISKKSVSKNLKDIKTNKDKYNIPKYINFKRKVKCNIYDGMQVFEMNPENKDNKTIMYIHGGGYLFNYSIFHWKLLKFFSKKGLGFTTPNYPLLPKYTYKESFEKVLNYYKEYSKKNDMNKVILAGDSAGGGMALALIEKVKELNLPLPKKVILISPFVDVTGANKELNKKDAMVDYEATLLLAEAWSNGDDTKEPIISPIYGNLKDLPPIKIYVGTYEILYDQGKELYNKLKKEKNKTEIYITEKMGHVFPILPIPEAKKAKEDMINFIEKE